MPHQVFISYSSEDRAIAEEVCRLLEVQEIGCWIAPRDIMPGQDYGVQIIDAIESTRVMVLLLSQHANDSVFVRNEVERAISKGKVVIPLRLQDVQPSRALELFVSRSQWIDAWTPPLPARVQILAAAIRGLLGMPAPDAPANDVTRREPAPPETAPRSPRFAVPTARSVAAVPILVLAGALVVAAAIWIGSLGGEKEAAPASTTPQPISTRMAGQPVNTALPLPALTAAGTPVPQPPQVTTAPPGPLPSPTSRPAVFAWPEAAIAGANAAEVRQLAVWDRERAFQVIWSPDGRTLAINNESRFIFLDARTLETVYELAPESNMSSYIALTADWTVLAACGNEGVRLWDLHGAQLSDVFAGSKGTWAAAFSPDATLLATKTEGSIKVWDTATATELRNVGMVGGSTVGAVAFSPDGKLLAGAGDTLVVWSTEDWGVVHTLSEREGSVQAVDFSPDGKLVAGVGLGGWVRVWDVQTGRQKRNFEHGGWVHDIAFSPDGSLVASASWDSTVKLWDIETGRDAATLSGHADRAESVAFSPDGRVLASGGIDDSLRLWGVAAPAAATPVSAVQTAAITPTPLPLAASAIAPGNVDQVKQVGIWDETSVYGLVYSPDGRTLIANTGDGLRFLDAQSLEQRGEITIASGSADLALSADGQFIAIALYDGLALWTATGFEVRSFPGSRGSYAAAFSPDGRRLATGTGVTVKIWDVATGAELQTLPGHRGAVDGVVFSPDGTQLISGSTELKFWDTATWGEVRTVGEDNSIVAITLSRDGRMLATGGSVGEVILWDATTGRQVSTLGGHTSRISALAFSPDGALLASASWDGTVRLWDTATRREVGTLSGHSERVEAVAFSPDGATLASGGSDRSLRLWGLGQ